MAERQISLTRDGSHTLFNAEIGEHYHSSFGAIQESEHIFISAGLDFCLSQRPPVRILEVGFGTGLNALLSLIWAGKKNKVVSYYGIEAFPIDDQLVNRLNYCDILGVPKGVLLQLHQATGPLHHIDNCFSIQLHHGKIQQASLPSNTFDVVFFDAFSPEAQPEMWTTEIFEKIGSALKKDGILTTYSCKGIVKRALIAAGFQIEKLPGPPGKRAFLRGKW